MYTRDEKVIKEDIMYKCFLKSKENENNSNENGDESDQVLCDVQSTIYQNTVENYQKGEELRKLKVENKFNLTPKEMESKYGIHVNVYRPNNTDIIRPIESILNSSLGELIRDTERLMDQTLQTHLKEFYKNRDHYPSQQIHKDELSSFNKPASNSYSQFEKQFDEAIFGKENK
jgi:hypothetical protein